MPFSEAEINAALDKHFGQSSSTGSAPTGFSEAEINAALDKHFGQSSQPISQPQPLPHPPQVQTGLLDYNRNYQSPIEGQVPAMNMQEMGANLGSDWNRFATGMQTLGSLGGLREREALQGLGDVFTTHFGQPGLPNIPQQHMLVRPSDVGAVGGMIGGAVDYFKHEYALPMMHESEAQELYDKAIQQGASDEKAKEQVKAQYPGNEFTVGPQPIWSPEHSLLWQHFRRSPFTLLDISPGSTPVTKAITGAVMPPLKGLAAAAIAKAPFFGEHMVVNPEVTSRVQSVLQKMDVQRRQKILQAHQEVDKAFDELLPEELEAALPHSQETFNMKDASPELKAAVKVAYKYSNTMRREFRIPDDVHYRTVLGGKYMTGMEIGRRAKVEALRQKYAEAIQSGSLQQADQYGQAIKAISQPLKFEDLSKAPHAGRINAMAQKRVAQGIPLPVYSAVMYPQQVASVLRDAYVHNFGVKPGSNIEELAKTATIMGRTPFEAAEAMGEDAPGFLKKRAEAKAQLQQRQHGRYWDVRNAKNETDLRNLTKLNIVRTQNFLALNDVFKQLLEDAHTQTELKGWVDVNVGQYVRNAAFRYGGSMQEIEQAFRTAGGDTIKLPKQAAAAVERAFGKMPENTVLDLFRRLYGFFNFRLDPLFEIHLAQVTGLMQMLAINTPKEAVGTFLAAAIAKTKGIEELFPGAIIHSHGGTFDPELLNAASDAVSLPKKILNAKSQIGYDVVHNWQRRTTAIGKILYGGVGRAPASVRQMAVDAFNLEAAARRAAAHTYDPRVLKALHEFLKSSVGDYSVESYARLREASRFFPLAPFLNHMKDFITNFPMQHPQKMKVLNALGSIAPGQFGADKYGGVPIKTATGEQEYGPKGLPKYLHYSAFDQFSGGMELLETLGNVLFGRPSKSSGLLNPVLSTMTEFFTGLDLEHQPENKPTAGVPFVEEDPSLVRVNRRNRTLYIKPGEGVKTKETPNVAVRLAHKVAAKQMRPIEMLATYKEGQLYRPSPFLRKALPGPDRQPQPIEWKEFYWGLGGLAGREER